jgi:hypothetical protein
MGLVAPFYWLAGPICPTSWPVTTTEDTGRPVSRVSVRTTPGDLVADEAGRGHGEALGQAHRCRPYIAHLL